jgi:hypothetical protein
MELFSGFEKTGLQQSVVRTISKNSLVWISTRIYYFDSN